MQQGDRQQVLVHSFWQIKLLDSA